METSSPYSEQPSLTEMIFGDGTPKNAAVTAMIVGTLLTLINHGDLLMAGVMPPVTKVFLTYCVPYCVTTLGAVSGKRSQWCRDITGNNPDDVL